MRRDCNNFILYSRRGDEEEKGLKVNWKLVNSRCIKQFDVSYEIYFNSPHESNTKKKSCLNKSNKKEHATEHESETWTFIKKNKLARKALTREAQENCANGKNYKRKKNISTTLRQIDLKKKKEREKHKEPCCVLSPASLSVDRRWLAFIVVLLCFYNLRGLLPSYPSREV